MKHLFPFVCLFVVFASTAQTGSDYIQYVNPLMGTDSKVELSNGNTYPAVCVPWGMNLWTPQTNVMGNGWTYQYAADRIRGFKQTHQPSPWMNDYGQFAIMPGTGKTVFDQDSRASWFSHKAETAKPHYYSVYLADCDVTTEIAPTERAACFRFTFPEAENAFIVVDALDRGSYIRVIPEERKIIGYTTRYSRGKLTNFKNYFVIYCDKDFTGVNIWDGKQLVQNVREFAGDHTGTTVTFRTKKGEQVNLRVASSFIGFEQAELNLQREIGSRDFDAVSKAASDRWNAMLGRIDVQDGDIDRLRTFYSCLYRALIFPNRLYEIDSAGNEVHWSPYDGQVHPGKMFAGTGFWDTFRALYPLLNLVYPDISAEMQEGLANDYREGGWLPEWSSPGYADIMIGNNSASVVAEAYLKGVRTPDIETLWEALVHGANNEGPVPAVGRYGVKYYNRLGYVPYDVGINENAARTLEYAYDDFAIWQLGKALGKPDKEIGIYAERCRNYRNLFDPSTNLMRGKNADGSFQAPFNPVKWGDAFTEGNSWHYTWSVFHDVQGLIGLMGGKERFAEMLDSVFALPPVYDDSYYGGVIHEIREMQISGMGQYAHGNQPIQHMIYLYNYAGQPWKAQYRVREVMDRLYRATPDGYCGDEDNGQTSAWYVFSAMGFYPVCPASDEYVLGAPLFDGIVVRPPNGATIRISAPGAGNARYIGEMTLNGQSTDRNFLKHSDMTRPGGTLDIGFRMQATPDKNRGTGAASAPYSFSGSADAPKPKKTR